MKIRISPDLELTVRKHLPTEELVVLSELKKDYFKAIKNNDGCVIQHNTGVFILFIKTMVLYIAQDKNLNLCILEIKDYPSFIKKITLSHEKFNEEIDFLMETNKESEDLLA